MAIPINSVNQGDCLEVMREISDKSIDMILCDLPYGTTACSWDMIIPFESLWEQYNRIIKDNGAIVLTGSEPFSSYLRLSKIKWYRYDWIWNKINGANFFNLKNRPLKTQEQILVFSKNANFTFNPQRILRTESSLKRDPIGSFRKYIRKGHAEHYGLYGGKSVFMLSTDGKKHPVDIITFTNQTKERYTQLKHPTQKPVALFEYLIKTYTNENDLVLDNCAGSGTTAIACINLNRNYILIEKEKKYIDIINKRIKDHVVQPEFNLEMLNEEVS